jgi:hypothetical protein
MMGDKEALDQQAKMISAYRSFMRWCINEHPEVVEEYRRSVKLAMSELKEMGSK